MTAESNAPPRQSPGSPEVVIVGLPTEVDLLTSAQVRDDLLGSINRGGIHLIVDAQQTTFLDSAGVNALVRARERTTRLGGSLHLVTQSRQLLRVMGITQLDRVLAIVPTMAEARRCTASPATIHTCGTPDR